MGWAPVGVGAAAVASVILAAAWASRIVELWTGVAWVGYLQVCALCNLTLRLLYQRSRPRADQWRVWALSFTAIDFAGGIGFGWAPLGLTIGGGLDVELRVLLVTLCMAAALDPGLQSLSSSVRFVLSSGDPSVYGGELLLHRPVGASPRPGAAHALHRRHGVRNQANRLFEQLVSRNPNRGNGRRFAAEEGHRRARRTWRNRVFWRRRAMICASPFMRLAFSSARCAGWPWRRRGDD